MDGTTPIHKGLTQVYFDTRRWQVSISPTFYEQLFCTKVFWAAFLYLHCRFVIFWCKEIGAKAARKMLVKLTTGMPDDQCTQFDRLVTQMCATVNDNDACLIGNGGLVFIIDINFVRYLFIWSFGENVPRIDHCESKFLIGFLIIVLAPLSGNINNKATLIGLGAVTGFVEDAPCVPANLFPGIFVKITLVQNWMVANSDAGTCQN